MTESEGGYYIPPEYAEVLAESVRTGRVIRGLVGWLCQRCYRFWNPEVEQCICGNKGPSKQPGPSETKAFSEDYTDEFWQIGDDDIVVGGGN